jgi:hypothetical protein
MSVMAEEQPPRSSALVRLIPWALWLLVIAVTLTAARFFGPVATGARDLPAYVAYGLALGWGPVCSLIGALITSRRRGSRIGWLLLGLGLVVSLTVFASGAGQSDHPAADAFNVLSDVLWIFSISLLALLILLFPDGRPLSPRWRPVVWFAALWPPCFLLIAVVFAPQDLLTAQPSGAPQVALAVLLIMTLIGMTASALLRFARSRGVERQQLKWFAFAWTVGLAMIVVGSGIPTWIGAIQGLGLYAPLAGIAVALFRHRLYDIDVLISRTFVYGALVAILAGLYSASIRLFNALFVGLTGVGSEEVLVITTLILATTFTPIKKRLEEIVERRYSKPSEEAALSPEGRSSTDLADPAVFRAMEARLRVIVRDELAQSGRAT